MLNGDWRINKSPSRTPEGRKIFYNRIRGIALKLVGLVCKRCGHKDRRVLQIDHVKGGGNSERRKFRGISYYYRIIREVVAGKKKKYQTLCANCHVLKRLENQS